jgi:hypothetical protein
MAACPSKTRFNGGGAVDVDELLRKLRLSEEESEGVFLAREDMSKLPKVK